MKVLRGDELQLAEEVLLKHLPRSFKVYGFLHAMNRSKPTTLQVLVDAWPEFKVIVCRPDPDNKCALEFRPKVTYFSMDEQVLRRTMTQQDVIDWSSTFFIGGCPMSHRPMLQEMSSERRVNHRVFVSAHLMYLPDISHLRSPAPDSELQSRISSLSLSHADMVNQIWKFGGDEKSLRNIRNIISSFPSCCISDEQGEPLSWLLMYDYCALGLLYTRPEHRGKGHASLLVSTMCRRIHAQGYPLFCYIEEENKLSLKLFKRLGFTEDPSYRALWFEFNF